MATRTPSTPARRRVAARKSPPPQAPGAARDRATAAPAASRRPASSANSAGKPAKAEGTVSRAAAKPGKASGKPAKASKLRHKLVRDSFTMPEADFSLIATLKARAMAAQRETKKSELLRAGLHALAGMDTPSLLAALQQLEPVKIGRPKSN